MKATRIAYSKNLTGAKYAKLEEQARRLGLVRSEVWERYGSIAGAALTDRQIRGISTDLVWMGMDQPQMRGGTDEFSAERAISFRWELHRMRVFAVPLCQNSELYEENRMTEQTNPNETSNEMVEERAYLALPPTVEGLLAQRNKPQRATLHDRVEAHYLNLYVSQEFRQLRDPLYKEQSIEGDLRDDDTRAAMMIREEAKHKGDVMVSEEKLAVLRHCMLVVERRYNVTRTQRRRLAEGLDHGDSRQTYRGGRADGGFESLQ